ncbi:hypothetical protein B0H10DRAFT_1968504 [Mycena sp. CBHHK59/15]|nr:hypothetical protein B0H10DRAFT_1968504 [Mycena sp. CBHHK59/15]
MYNVEEIPPFTLKHPMLRTVTLVIAFSKGFLGVPDTNLASPSLAGYTYMVHWFTPGVSSEPMSLASNEDLDLLLSQHAKFCSLPLWTVGSIHTIEACHNALPYTMSGTEVLFVQDVCKAASKRRVASLAGIGWHWTLDTSSHFAWVPPCSILWQWQSKNVHITYVDINQGASMDEHTHPPKFADTQQPFQDFVLKNGINCADNGAMLANTLHQFKDSPNNGWIIDPTSMACPPHPCALDFV